MAANVLQLDILRQLREEAGLTQDDMARLCGLQGQMRRQTAGAWERGDIVPSRARRIRFIGYLWDHLHLRTDPSRFEHVWELLMREWGWEPISDKEWASFTQRPRPPRESEVEQKLAELTTTLHQLQSSARAPAPDQPSAALQLPRDKVPAYAPLPATSRMPWSRNPLFVGRVSSLLALAEIFATGDTAAISQVETAAATGMGGIGKTQVASEFVHRYGQFFAGGVFWLSFEHADAISSEFAACGGAGALELRPDFATRPLEEQVRLVQAAFQAPTPRLLVFDNCEDPELITRWRPTSGGCRVLVTSRSQEWDLALGVQTHALDVLRREESLQLLQKHKLNTSLEVLDAIARELGDLPLALHLAGSYLYRYRRVLTAEQYLAFLRDPALLDHPSLQGAGPSPTGHTQHVARTFALSFERLDPEYELDARARQILVHVALLAPGEPVPYDLLAGTLDADLADPRQAVRMEEAVVRLLELGLVEIQGEVQGEVQGERQLWLHRLMTSFVRASARDVWDAALPQVEATIQRKLDDYYQQVKPLPLLPIQTHLRHVVSAALPRRDAACATLSQALARYLWGLGEFADAISYTEQALVIRQALYGDTQDETAASHHLLGILLHERYQFADAHAHLQRALSIRHKLVGEMHYDTANTMVNIGGVLWNEQRNQEAITCLERALTICDEALDEDHPLVAEIAMMLGLCMLDWDYNLPQARHYLQEAVRIRRLKLGEDHVYTAAALNNLGYFLHQTGELEAAGDYYQQGLAIRQRVLGEKNVNTANSLYCLGRLRRMQARWDEAQAYLEEALMVFLNAQGIEYALTASALNELGATLLGKHDLARAHRYVEQALAIRMKLYHAEHPHVANTLQNLGEVMLAQGDYAEAERVLRQALHARQQARDPENLRVAETLFTLGQVAERSNDLDLALERYMASHAIYGRHHGSGGEQTRAVADALALLAT